MAVTRLPAADVSPTRRLARRLTPKTPRARV